jgi:hypothetical protein
MALIVLVAVVVLDDVEFLSCRRHLIETPGLFDNYAVEFVRSPRD